jgi:hypothetical protein
MTKKPAPIWSDRMKGVAGLAPLLTGADSLGRPIIGSAVCLPEIVLLSGRQLIYSEAGTVQEVETKGLLDSFLSLASQRSADDEDILAFAKRFGPLRCCARHAIVAYHRPLATGYSPLGPAASVGELMHFDGPDLFCGPTRTRKSRRCYCEPLSVWRRYAKDARDLLEIAARLRELPQEHPNLVDAAIETACYVETIAERWKRLDGLDFKDPSLEGAWSRLADPWQRIAEDLNRWLFVSDVGAFVSAKGREFSLTIGANRFTWSVLAIITLEIISAVAAANGLATCSNCAMPFLLRRKPVADERRYCSDCRMKGIPLRDAARDLRKRKAEAKRGH